MENTTTFGDLGLSSSTLDAITKKGFEIPSPIQAKVIPVLLQGNVDIIGQAQTGTGKTAAFGLPLIDLLSPAKHVQALILTPTRELAVQVANEIDSLQGDKKLEICAVYGGQSITDQIRRLRRGVDIVVGTPGRVIDHINRKTLKLDRISRMILDEADEMLNMGFIEDVEKILENVNEDKSMLLFSATMPKELLSITDRFMRNKEYISVKKEQMTTNLTKQVYYEISQYDKFDALCRVIDFDADFYGMVFCKTKVDVDMVVNKLQEKNYRADGLHGDISQTNRERILNKFKRKQINILIATDVAARGIDINDLNYVINYSLPQNPESYVHRIGRTGRAGKEGNAVTFVLPSESRKMGFFRRVTKTDIQRGSLPEVSELIKVKQERLNSDLANIISDEKQERFLEAAQTLLADKDPEQLVASLLHHSFREHLDPTRYKEIRPVKQSRDNFRQRGEFRDGKGGRNGKGGNRERRNFKRRGGNNGRLFVAQGRLDDMTPTKLISFIRKKARVDKAKIHDIEIYDKFSFVNVALPEAEIIIDAFKPRGRGKRSLIEMAK